MTATTEAPGEPLASHQDRAVDTGDPDQPTTEQPTNRNRRRRPVRWVVMAASLVVVALVVLALAQVVRTLGQNAAGDPRSTRAAGTAALAQLLRDQGVEVVPADTSVRAEQAVTADSTLVLIAPRLLDPDRVSALIAARPGRIVLVAPTSSDLTRLGLDEVEIGAQLSAPAEPGCTEPAAVRSGGIHPTPSPVYAVPAGATGCYPMAGGSAMLVTQLDGVPLTIIPAVAANETLAVAGNAALAMNVLGEHPRLVWLMARNEPSANGTDDGPAVPGVLPGWWPMLVTQLLVGLVVVGLWRGRRLGPIIYERLPVRIRSSETVEGHGRLYQRQEARGAAAAALRAAALSRLTSRYGHVGDPLALAEALAGRTGRPIEATRTLLAGPDPVTDAQLLDLKTDLDALEQEARHP